MSILPYRADPLPEEERAVHRKVLAGAYTATVDDRARQLACSGTWTLTLPPATDLGPGWWCYVENIGTGAITIDPEGSDTIDGAATASIPPYETRLITCDGAAAYDGVVIRQGAGAPSNATFDIGEEDNVSSTIRVLVQLLDEAGNSVARRSFLPVYIASDASGATPTRINAIRTASIGAVVTPTIAEEHVIAWVVTDETGQVDIDLTELDAATVYLCIVMPDSSVVVSDEIEFTT